MTVFYKADQGLCLLKSRLETSLYPGPSGLQRPAASCKGDVTGPGTGISAIL